MRILLIGATSYVASYFIDECHKRGWDICVLIRDKVRHAILSPRDRDLPSVSSPEDVRSLGSVDAIVNFAYPKGLSTTLKTHGATRLLVQRMIDAARQLSPRIVIQVSTQSVFGYSFTREPRPVPVWWAIGDSYNETKVIAEWLFLLKAWRYPYVKVVLRLGDVIGPGAYWISELARRILFENPLSRGASNATYVLNVVDYLSHLLSTNDGELRGFGVFHHLAEFSSYSSCSIAQPIADAMGLRPLYSDAPTRPAKTSAGALLKTAARYSLMFLPEPMRDRIDNRRAWRGSLVVPSAGTHVNESDFHPTLFQSVEFRSHTLPSWSPRFDLQAALRETISWVRGAGYVALR